MSHESNIQSAHYFCISCKLSHVAEYSIILYIIIIIVIEKNGMYVRCACLSFRNCVTCARGWTNILMFITVAIVNAYVCVWIHVSLAWFHFHCFLSSFLSCSQNCSVRFSLALGLHSCSHNSDRFYHLFNIYNILLSSHALHIVKIQYFCRFATKDEFRADA